MARHRQTPSQTIGPFFAYGLTPGQYGYKLADIATPRVGGLASTEGVRIRLEGQVYDGTGNPVDDAMLELWQCDSAGRYPGADPGTSSGTNTEFTGFARCGTGTDPEARFVFETVKPGASPAEPGQAPHLNLTLFARGLLSHVHTRVYFEDDAPAHAADPVLAAVPEARRRTLIATRREGAEGIVYRFDIHLQGDRETVFFDL